MLFQQAGFLALGSNPLHPERLAGDQRQRQRCAQNLAAAFAL
jgi:hypothetical protein